MVDSAMVRRSRMGRRSRVEKITQIARNWTAAGAVLVLGLVEVGCHRSDAGFHPVESMPLSTDSREAQRLYHDGLDLLDKQRRIEASRLFTMATERDPDFAMAHWGLALTHDDYGQRRKALHRALDLALAASEAERWMILGLDANFRGARSEELEFYRRITEAHPGNERGHYMLGEAYRLVGAHEEAVASFERALALAPEWPQVYNLLGYTQKALGRFDEAKATFERYIELMPAEANPYDSYAELLMKMGEFEASIESYERALERKADFHQSYIGKAHCLMLLNRGDEARATLATLREISTPRTQRDAWQWVVHSYLFEGDHAGALNDAKEILAVDRAAGDFQGEALAMMSIARIQLERGDLAAVEVSLREISTMLDDEPKATVGWLRTLHLQGRLAVEAGDLDRASQVVTQLQGLVEHAQSGTFEQAVAELQGLIALAQGNWAGALQAFEGMDTGSPRTHYLIALAHRGAGNSEGLRAAATRAAHFNGMHVDYPYVRRGALALLEPHGSHDT